jgi:HPt (histidine-containing phosphotransfer) domain-containing protein
MPLAQFLNPPELLSRVENDYELIDELLHLFQIEFPRFRHMLHAELACSRLGGVEKAAHTLKGMLANLSVETGASVAAKIEASAHDRDIPTLTQEMATFDREADGLLDALAVFMTGIR